MTVSRHHITVTAPSNIAFVKYWGKTGRQHPINASISMTLKNCITTCHVDFETGHKNFALTRYDFEGSPNPAFQTRVETYLKNIADMCPWLDETHLSIQTENSFPHSAGIASSASAFAAIGYALAQIEKNIGILDGDINRRASSLARLGSGSAARSINGPFTQWGEMTGTQGHDDYATPIQGVHADFEHICDTILIVDDGEKPISSSIGHSLMNDHPYRTARIDQANKNAIKIIQAMQNSDWMGFGKIIEEEALSLHAMMMTSTPSYLLLAPASLTVINAIRKYRADTHHPVYFTIDAGPNIHVIYPQSCADAVKHFIETNLKPLCQNGQIIWDECGRGANVKE